jgi:acetylornithine deacetylase/succinyl-diaminopimelate desuccinylase-like protein
VIGQLGPDDAAALLVLAHSDTVQIREPDKWSFDPFCGKVQDGRILGLGSADDKWALAVILGVIRQLLESGRTLQKRIIFASTIDEEHGVSNGTALLALSGIRAEAGLYLDGTGMRVSIGNLGGSNLYLIPRQPLSPQQLSQNAESLQQACSLFSKNRQSAFDRPFLSRNAMKNSSAILFRSENEKGPFFYIGFYTVPDDDPAQFCTSIEKAAADALGPMIADYQLSYRKPWFEPVLISPETPIFTYLTQSICEVRKTEPVITTSAKQDSFVLNRYAKIPTISFGPASLDAEVGGRGAPHQPDEYLGTEELWQAYQIAWHTICKWLDNP